MSVEGSSTVLMVSKRHFRITPRNGHRQGRSACLKCATNRHGPPQAPIRRSCIVAVGVRDILSNLTFRAGAVTSCSTPKANSKAFNLSQGSEKRRVEIGYAPGIQAEVIPSSQLRD
jgi:hypothetical protein